MVLAPPWGCPAPYPSCVRITIRVQPRARVTAVGGRYGSDDPPVLIVRVKEPAVDGRANEACRLALAHAFGVRTAAVRILSGRSSRTKVLEVDGADPKTVTGLLHTEAATGGR